MSTPIKTKDEIIDSVVNLRYDSQDGYSHTTIAKAMDEYANQEKREEAIAFADWLKDNSYTKSEKGWYQYHTVDKTLPNGVMMSFPVYNFTTLDQLYNLFKNQTLKP